MGKYLVIEKTNSDSKKALELALEEIRDSDIISHEVTQCEGKRIIWGEFGPGREEKYRYFKATVIFNPGEEYLVEEKKKEEAIKEQKRIKAKLEKERIEAREREEEEEREERRRRSLKRKQAMKDKKEKVELFIKKVFKS